MAAVDAAMQPQLSEEERQIYDRQLRVWGVEAQKRMRDSSVLLIGVRGLSCEVAKNIVLAGIGSLVLLDDSNVTPRDLAANFLVTAEDVGKNRAESSVSHLRQLNPNVTITANTSSLASILASNPTYLSQFRAICMVGQPIDMQVAVNSLLRDQAATDAASPAPPAFFAGECFGIYAFFFEDLVRHSYTHTRVRKDDRGNEEETIASDTKIYQRPIAAVVDGSDNFVTLAKAFGKKRQEKSALDAWLAMRTVMDWRRHQQQAALADADAQTRYPSISDEAAAASLYERRDFLAQRLSLSPTSLPRDLLLRVGRMAGNEVSHVCAVVGGILGQEVLKVLSGKDEPLNNTFVFSAEEGYGIMKEL